MPIRRDLSISNANQTQRHYLNSFARSIWPLLLADIAVLSSLQESRQWALERSRSQILCGVHVMFTFIIISFYIHENQVIASSMRDV